ncbi:hypothetical protein CFC21_045695 [Triticum aestivum]|uniref:DUF1618 domain-containing protein n=2 Tax=Triticum aestivum TaxID=4565 RepID=A0A3B6GQG0_WHEAT|nr:uncharacterized protein LOC123077020 isoform X2 [Triticum aestivum]KAF7034714.1 hypothetical protein CFC21_045695 [Triticum aestivum]
MALTVVPVRPSAHPDWALLNKTGRISDNRNETTAGCRTPEGQAVEVSFCLADPPGVSHFSVHCPGLEGDDYSDTPPLLICAEGAFVLFSVTLNVPEWGSVHHFVYSARGPSGNRPSLHLLPEPDPEVPAFQSQQFGILPCGGGHFAVAFLDRNWIDHRDCWEYRAYVFSSTTRAWSRTKPSMPRLSQSDKVLLDRHYSCKQITVGETSLGWVDLLCGIVLLCNLFDKRPVIKYIPFPASRVPLVDEDGVPDIAAEHLCDVSCCGDLIKFVQIDFDEPDYGSSGIAWKATTWNRKLSWDDWRNRRTVDVAEISVDTSYSALLPELLDDENKLLELKNLIFINPTLSIQDDHLLYIRAMVKAQDDTTWIVALDMKHASLSALVPVSTQPFCGVTMYSPCAFPKYYLDNMPVEADVVKPVVRQLYGTNKRSHRRQKGILNPNTSSQGNPVARGERASVLDLLFLHRRNIYFFFFIVLPIMAKVFSYIYSMNA